MEQYLWKWIALGTGISLLVFRRCFSKLRAIPIGSSMSGKTVVITGANCGIGKATAVELAKRQARVILACRDLEKGRAAVDYIRRKSNNDQIQLRELDLASLSSVKSFADNLIKEETKIDVLINNAGVFQCPYSQTKDGFETQMGVNHLGHFYLTNLLLDKLKQSAPSRIVIVSSSLAKRGVIDFENLNSEKSYDKRKGYSNSKLANNLFAKELSRRLEGSNVSVLCLHPGMVLTDLGRHVWPRAPIRWFLYPLAWLIIKSPYEGCQTVVYCSSDKTLEGKCGYFGNCKEEDWPPNSTDEGVAKKLWEVSEKLTGIA